MVNFRKVGLRRGRGWYKYKLGISKVRTLYPAIWVNLVEVGLSVSAKGF